MKTFITSRRIANLAALPLLVAVSAAIPATSKAAEEPGAAQKTHTLFMGADFSVAQGKEFFRVRDVTGSAFLVLEGSQEVAVPMKGAPINLRIQPTLKLTEISANVANLVGERAYTPENDPVYKFTKAMAYQANMAAQEALQSSSIDHLAEVTNWQLQSAPNHLPNAILPGGAPNPSPGLNPNTRNPFSSTPDGTAGSMQQNIFNDNVNAMNMAGVPDGKPMDNLGDPIGHEQFDAMEFTFSVSSERKLNNPYVVIDTRFHERDTKPGFYKHLIYAQSIEPVGPRPMRVHILAGGLPPGFLLQDYRVHLYNRGEEVATNVSSDRVALSRDEAFEYVKLEYISAHKGATLPAVPALGKLPDDLPGRLANGQFHQTYYVKVSKDGIVQGAYLDDDCTEEASDSYLVSLVKDIRFKPALRDGVPVDSTAPLKLGQLVVM